MDNTVILAATTLSLISFTIGALGFYFLSHAGKERRGLGVVLVMVAVIIVALPIANAPYVVLANAMIAVSILTVIKAVNRHRRSRMKKWKVDYKQRQRTYWK